MKFKKFMVVMLMSSMLIGFISGCGSSDTTEDVGDYSEENEKSGAMEEEEIEEEEVDEDWHYDEETNTWVKNNVSEDSVFSTVTIEILSE